MDIAQRLRIEGPTLTRMVKALEAEELILRRPDPTDGRAKLLVLSLSGETALEQIFQVSDELRVKLLSGIDEAELATTERVLDQIIQRLDDGLGV